MRFIKLKDLWPIENMLIIRFKPVEEKTRCKLSSKRRYVNTSARGQAMKAVYNNKLPTQTNDVMVNPRNPVNPDSNPAAARIISTHDQGSYFFWGNVS
jgi:hypothetical protein